MTGSAAPPELLNDGQRVGLWGWGREGLAAYQWIRARRPDKPLHVFASADEVAAIAALGDPNLSACVVDDQADFSAFEWIIKSPGISPYQGKVIDAQNQGTRFIGGTFIWAQMNADRDGLLRKTVCVTGTKGKSTSSALLAHLLRAAGLRTLLAGNIGLPLLDARVEEPVDVRVIELSSYQTGDLAASGARPDVAIVVNVFPEHLDWHGSETQYVEDKLKLVTHAQPRTAVLNVLDARLSALQLPASRVAYYGDANGWHLDGDDLYRGAQFVMDTVHLPLPGRHNRGNLCAVLTAIEALGMDAVPLAKHAESFMPLPNRLQRMGERDGIAYINDSIATTPHATLAALSCFEHADVALIVGGHDRGLDWHEFAEALRGAIHAPVRIVTMGQNGPKIHALLEPLAAEGTFRLESASTLEEAVAKAEDALTDLQGSRPKVLLLSPGAPSFGLYRDYVERGRHFASLTGFDPERIAAIQGLGVA